jgi:UDPglucose 6-dehydrogenase
MQVAVMGTGHVGLVTGVAFASLGHDVVATDIDGEKIRLLLDGVSPFYEAGLEEALRREMAAGRLSFTLEASEALREAEAVFVCVGTPARASGEANLVAMETSAREIARHAPDGVVVIEKSTVPAGTAERVATRSRGNDRDSCSTWPRTQSSSAGTALRDALEPERT